MQTTRRQFLSAATGLAISHALLGRIGFAQQPKRTRVVLLGTKGGPRVVRRVAAILRRSHDSTRPLRCRWGMEVEAATPGVALHRCVSSSRISIRIII